jgi:hypothetical protein
MTWQSKPLMRFDSIEEKHRLDDALAILALHRRDAILEAVAMSAKELLRSSNLEQSLPKVIARIGQATGVDRVHILAIDPIVATSSSVISGARPGYRHRRFLRARIARPWSMSASSHGCGSSPQARSSSAM